MNKDLFIKELVELLKKHEVKIHEVWDEVPDGDDYSYEKVGYALVSGSMWLSLTDECFFKVSLKEVFESEN